MLDFYLIRDDQPISLSQLRLIGGIEENEFEEAQDADIIESHLDYYGKFRLSNELVRRKIAQLGNPKRASLSNLADILKQANAAECGIIAFGD